MNLAFRLRTTTNKAPNTLKRYIAPRFVEHKTTASSRETAAAATPPPADEWARPVPAAALSRSTCRCVRQLNANTPTQLRPTCSLSVSADACRRPHLPGPAKLHSTLYKYIYFLLIQGAYTREMRVVCMHAPGRTWSVRFRPEEASRRRWGASRTSTLHLRCRREPAKCVRRR